MTTPDPWEQLERALRMTREGCMSIVSPHALALVLAEHREQQQGTASDDQRLD